MAVNELTVQRVALTGVVPSYAAANADGSNVLNSGRVMLHVKNGGGAPINVTIQDAVSCSHGVQHTETVAVANGAEKMIGPFDRTRFNNASTGKFLVNFSDVASVTVAAIELP